MVNIYARQKIFYGSKVLKARKSVVTSNSKDKLRLQCQYLFKPVLTDDLKLKSPFELFYFLSLFLLFLVVVGVLVKSNVTSCATFVVKAGGCSILDQHSSFNKVP